MPWHAPTSPKVDEGRRPDGDDLARHYEAVRSDALDGRAGLAVALLMATGMAGWMRGWRACTAPPAPARSPQSPPPADVVGVLASMALACTGSG